MHNKAAIFLQISSAILILYAAAFLFMPDLLGKLVGFTHHSPNTLVEVTAFYGGLELGIAIYLLWSTKTIYRSRHALMMYFLYSLQPALPAFLEFSVLVLKIRVSPSSPFWKLVGHWRLTGWPKKSARNFELPIHESEVENS